MNVIAACGGLFAGIGSLFTVIGGYIFFNRHSYGIDEEPALMMLPLMFVGMGLLFAGMGFVMLHRVGKDKRRKKQLIQLGKFIWADVTEVFEDWSVQVNGQPGLRVCAEWKDPHTDVVYQFQSDPHFGRIPQYPEGYQLKVYVDPADYMNYTVALNEGRVAFIPGR